MVDEQINQVKYLPYNLVSATTYLLAICCFKIRTSSYLEDLSISLKPTLTANSKNHSLLQRKGLLLQFAYLTRHTPQNSFIFFDLIFSQISGLSYPKSFFYCKTNPPISFLRATLTGFFRIKST